MSGPGAELTSVRLTRDIITILGCARLSGDRYRNGIKNIEYLVKSSKRILSDSKARTSTHSINSRRLYDFDSAGFVTVTTFTAPLVDQRSLGNIPFHVWSEWR